MKKRLSVKMKSNNQLLRSCRFHLLISSPNRRATSSKRFRFSSSVSPGASLRRGCRFLSQGSGRSCRGVIFFLTWGCMQIAASVLARSHESRCCASFISRHALQMLSNSPKVHLQKSSCDNPIQPTPIPKSSQIPTDFFFTVGIIHRGSVDRDSIAPLGHIFRSEAVGKVHQRHIERFALALRRRHYTAPQIGTQVGKTCGGNLGNLLRALIPANVPIMALDNCKAIANAGFSFHIIYVVMVLMVPYVY